MKTALGPISQSLLCGFRGILCLGLIGFVVLGSFFYLPAKVYFHVTERYVFLGDGADALVYLGIVLPTSGPYQRVENVEISWDGLQREEKSGIVDVIKLSGEKDRQEDLEATIEYDVKLPQGPVSWSAPVEIFQQHPQAGIESEEPCFQEKAASLDSGSSDKNAYKVYSFTADYLTYSREDMECTSVSALKTFEIGSCVCAGYARLMTALCRASDIPAQMVIGLVYPDPMFRSHITGFPQDPSEMHAWVEYYSYGSWKMADPTWGAKGPKFLQFNRNDGRHLAYGEQEQFFSLNNNLEAWALDKARFVLGNGKCFRYIATSTSDQISFVPITSVNRVWDGRWVNTLLVWGITTWILYKYRYEIIGIPRQEANLQNNP